MPHPTTADLPPFTLPRRLKGASPPPPPTFPVRAAACAVPCDAAAVVRAGWPILTPPSATAPTSPSSPTLVASSRLRLLAGRQWPAVLLLVSEKVDPRRGCVTAQAAVDLGAVREHSGAATSPCPSGVRRNAYLRFSELDAPKSCDGHRLHATAIAGKNGSQLTRCAAGLA